MVWIILQNTYVYPLALSLFYGDKTTYSVKGNLVPPPPTTKERLGTHCLCMHEIFSLKTLCTYVVRMWKIILAKNKELSLK